nr:disease resistance protein rpm1 [Quercus suber]
MDVEAAVSIVIRKLTDLLIQESIIFNKAINEECVDDILTVVYKVEDAIEAFVLQRMYARGMGFAWRYFFVPKNLKADRDLRNKIEKIKNMIEELDKSRAETLKKSNQVKPLRIPQLTSHRSSYQDEGLTMNQQNNNSSYPVDEETEVIGFREGIRKLVVMLTDRVGLHVISLKGDHGSGKTTLATAIYKSREVKGHFDCRVWVLASGNLTDVLLSTLEQIVNATVDKKSTKKELVEKIRKNLQEKRYLVVLDDLQELRVWKKLLDTFPDPKNGSRVMLTTSNHHVAFSADTRVELHRLNPLNDEDTWELFLKKVRLPDDSQFSESDIFKLKRKINRRCKGLPLAITVLGVGEGFVRQSPGMTPEDTVEIYLDELVKRSMIQISKRRNMESQNMPYACSYLVGLKATKRSHADPRAAAKPFCPQAIGQFQHREGNEVPFRMVPASNFEALDAKDLDTWEVGKGALTSLQELEIRHCDKLKGLPDELLSLGNIEIVLTNMPPEFVANVRAVNLEENLSLSQTLEF